MTYFPSLSFLLYTNVTPSLSPISTKQLFFCRNWSSRDAPMWHHFPCSLSKGECFVCQKREKEKETFSQQNTSPHSEKSPAVTHVPFFKLHAKWHHVDGLLPDQFPQKNNCILLNPFVSVINFQTACKKLWHLGWGSGFKKPRPILLVWQNLSKLLSENYSLISRNLINCCFRFN